MPSPLTMMPSGDAKPALRRFLLLLVASRLLYLLLIHPSNVTPHLYDELYEGTMAQELVTGLKMPFTEYRTSNYMLGTLVVGALASGFFLLFGPTLLALKLAPLLVFTLALVFWYWTIQQYAGERMARYFALLFCVSPPLLTAFSVTALGSHGESLLFSALTVFLLFRVLSDKTGSPALPVLLGLVAGIGLWFCYTYGLTLLTLLGFWVWHDKGRLRLPPVLWFALGFLVGFSPWIVFNLQTHFAGLVVYDKNVWEHFGLANLWDGLAHPLELAPLAFLHTIASNDYWDLYRRAVNRLYSLLYLGPMVTAGVLRLKTGRSDQTGAHPTQPTLVGFSILYLVVFTLAVQFSDFKSAYYHLPAYPFLFFLTAYSLARCQEAFPNIQRQILTVLIASMVLLGLGAHAPLLSLDQPGYILSAKGYTYAILPRIYWRTHAPAGSSDRELLLELVQRRLLSSILPKLSSEDQRELSRGIALLLAGKILLNGQAEDFSRIERLVPPGSDRYFYYEVGARAMDQHSNELPKAIATVEFLRHRSATAYRLALIGIYRGWPWFAAVDSSLESLADAPASLTPELQPHYWRALGLLAGRSWYDTDQSVSLLNARLQAFVPRLDPPVQRYFLQGVGEVLFTRLIAYSPWVPATELERFPPAYQGGILEGWGMALGEVRAFSLYPWKVEDSPYWMAATKGLSTRSLSYVQQGKAEFEALFEGPAARALEPPPRQ